MNVTDPIEPIDGDEGNMLKDPKDWTTGDEPMTGAQESYLKTLSDQADEELDPTLTKAELAELLFERLGLNKRESKDMVEAFFDLIYATLLSGDDVKMSGFGNFNIRRKAPRPGRNPRTGEAIPIKARHVVTFHASHKLKGVVQGDTPPADEFE